MRKTSARHCRKDDSLFIHNFHPATNVSQGSSGAVQVAELLQKQDEGREREAAAEDCQERSHAPETDWRATLLHGLVDSIKVPVPQFLHHPVVLQLAQAAPIF